MMARQATATKAKEQTANEAVADQATSKGEVAVFHAPRLPFHPAIEQRFGVEKGQWKVLVEAIFPAAQSADSVVMALSYCHHRKLDIFKKPVHIVPMWDSKRGGYVETIWPSIAELRTTASRTKQYAGCDEAVFGPMKTMTFTGKVREKQQWIEKEVEVAFPEWCRITVYRLVNGVPCKFVGPKVVWLETYATIGNSSVPNTMWQERPEGQIEKCAEAAALRRAFPEELGNEYAAEEMEGRRLDVLPPEKEVMVADRDAGPPRQADAGAANSNEQIVDAEYTTVTDGTAHDADGVVQEKGSHVSGDPVDDQPENAGANSMDGDLPVAFSVDSTGLSFIQFADAYIAAIEKNCRSTKDVYDFASLNRRKLDKLFSGHKPSSDRVRKAADDLLAKLRPLNQTTTIVPPKKKDDPISTGPQPKKDDGPPRRAAKPVIADPEEQLKQIKGILDAVTDPNNLEDVWLEQCIPIYEQFSFPADKSAADAMYKAAEKRLGID